MVVRGRFDYGDHADGEFSNLPSSVPNQEWPAHLDSISRFRSGFEVRSYHSFRRVLMFCHFTELSSDPTLVSIFRFEYVEEPAGSTLHAIHYTGVRRESNWQVNQRSTLPLRFMYSLAWLATVFELISAESERTFLMVSLALGISGGFIR